MLGKNKKLSKKITAFNILLIVLAVIFFVSQKTFAASIDLNIPTGLGTSSLTFMISRVIQVFLGVLGIIALGLVLYAGFLWMTSGGNEEKITQAKKIMVNAVIGLAIILSAFAITSFIISKLTEATTQGGSGQGTQTGPNFPGTALGGGILESVYPVPNSQNNPRNTLIMVMFKEPVQNIIQTTNLPTNIIQFNGNTTSIQQYCADQIVINPNLVCGIIALTSNEPNVKIYNSATPNNFVAADQVVVTTTVTPGSPTNSNKNFVFEPVADLGSSSSPTNYTTLLTDHITKLGGGTALQGGFDWSYGIGTFSDNTPPTVVSVFPVNNSTVARNAVVQMIFSEPMAATTVSGAVDANGSGFQNITLKYNNNTQYIQGQYTVANQFQTVEFLSSLDCGQGQQTNSCGNQIYCLPASQNFVSTITASVTDAAGNHLTNAGNNGCQADPPAAQNCVWNFSTNDTLELAPPFIPNNLTYINPDDEQTEVPRNQQVKAVFNEPISATTANTTNFILIHDIPYQGQDCTAIIGQPDQYGQYPGSPSACWPLYGFGVQASSTDVTYTPYGPLEPVQRYNARLLQYIQDLYQNCYKPPLGPDPVP